MQRLTSFDASFLANEKGNGHMAIGAVMVCEGEAPSREQLLEHVDGRLHLLPRFRQRLAFPPLALGRPLWIDHPEFELDEHVRRVSLPRPGTEESFHETVEQLISPPLDRARPLWELWLVEGLAEQRFRIVYRVHHALADGFSAVDIASLLFDLDPDAGPPGGDRSWTPSRPPSRAQLAKRAATGLVATLRRLGTWLAGALRDPRTAGRGAAEGFAGLREVAVAMAVPAPTVPLNGPIGPTRRFAWTGCDLAAMQRVRESLGGTVNDISLAICAGALRRWLEDAGALEPELELKALVPVSIRGESERGSLGNRLTAMRGPLPVGIPDPVERLAQVSAAMSALKRSKQPLGAQVLWRVNDWFREFAPPLGPTAAINFSTRLFNLLVTNLPGPPTPLYLLGREMTGIYPVGFLAKDHRLAIAIISYSGQVNFGLLADLDPGPNPQLLAGYLERELELLVEAAARRD